MPPSPLGAGWPGPGGDRFADSELSDLSLMPGGGIARRPLHVILVADCSGSMEGERMQALNYSVAEMCNHLAEWERDQERADVMIRAVAFATQASWHIERPVRVSELRWENLRPVPRGRTNFAPALRLVADALSPTRLERRALRPSVILITDGLATDSPDQLDAAFESMRSTPGARSAVRLAVAIGADANSRTLRRFVSDPSFPVLVADRTDEIADRLVAASIAVSELVEPRLDGPDRVGGLFTANPAVVSDRETII